MQTQSFPLIDAENPLYCPAVSAAAYIETIRRRLQRNRINSHGTRSQNDQFLSSFARVLDLALLEDESCFSNDSTCYDASGPDLGQTSRSHSSGLGGLAYHVPPWELDNSSNSLILPSAERKLVSRPSRPTLKRKRSSFSDILGSPQHARSFHSFHDSSFEVIVKREKLGYSGGPGFRTSPFIAPTDSGGCWNNADRDTAGDLARRIRILEDELYGPAVGTETPRGIGHLLGLLDNILPGIRLKQRILALPNLSHQKIVDFLASTGHLNVHVLTILRTSEIQSLSLSASMIDEDGLNLAGKDILPIFGKPNSFLFLSELSLCGTLIQDTDITHIHHLPRLSTLFLNNTGIGNEAIYHLVSLKRSLNQLSVATNYDIDDDAVPALLLLSKLSFLSILDTRIDMPGLRRIAFTVSEEARVIDIEIPSACDHYIDNIDTRYLLDLRPPLIATAGVCEQLSSAALMRNLSAHAAVNPAIVPSGTKKEMADRLHMILVTREMDLLVRAMVQGPD